MLLGRHRGVGLSDKDEPAGKQEVQAEASSRRGTCATSSGQRTSVRPVGRKMASQKTAVSLRCTARQLHFVQGRPRVSRGRIWGLLPAFHDPWLRHELQVNSPGFRDRRSLSKRPHADIAICGAWRPPAVLGVGIYEEQGQPNWVYTDDGPQIQVRRERDGGPAVSRENKKSRRKLRRRGARARARGGSSDSRAVT